MTGLQTYRLLFQTKNLQLLSKSVESQHLQLQTECARQISHCFMYIVLGSHCSGRRLLLTWCRWVKRQCCFVTRQYYSTVSSPNLPSTSHLVGLGFPVSTRLSLPPCSYAKPCSALSVSTAASCTGQKVTGVGEKHAVERHLWRRIHESWRRGVIRYGTTGHGSWKPGADAVRMAWYVTSVSISSIIFKDRTVWVM